MQWTDASGQVYSGVASGSVSGLIPYLATDTTGGAFPGGSVRWTNLGYDSGVAFDLLVTVSTQPAYYSDTVAIEYWNPQSSYTTQAIYTTAGFACLGFGKRVSQCSSGALLDATTARCTDGTPTTLNAAEFDFTFVEAGTTTQMPPFGRAYLTFYDVDGDVVNGYSMFEFVSIVAGGVASRTTAPSTTLEGGTFYPSEALFAVSSEAVNVPTDFGVSPATPSAA